VPSIAIFALLLIDVEERRSNPIRVEQVIRSEAEKQQRKAKQKAKVKGQPGRPKGSKNRDKTQVTLTEELLRIQKMAQNQLTIFQEVLSIRYLVLDGHFGNNKALQMVRQCGLHLISKLRHDAAFILSTKGPMLAKALPGSMATSSTMTNSQNNIRWQPRSASRSRPAFTRRTCCIMSLPSSSMWSSCTRPTSKSALVPMWSCFPVIWYNPMTRSSTITTSDFSWNSTFATPNNTGASKIG